MSAAPTINNALQFCDWLLVANGAPMASKDLMYLKQDRRIMALDGGYHQLKDLNLEVDILLGDFDSICPEILNKAKNSAIHVVEAFDQNQTDLVKGIAYLDSLKATSILICNATGNRLQHTAYNLRVLKKCHHPHRVLMMVTAEEMIQYVENDQLIIRGCPKDSIGILGFPRAIIDTKGLKYDVMNYPLDFELTASVSNELEKETAYLSVKGSALVIQENRRVTVPLPPLSSASKDFYLST